MSAIQIKGSILVKIKAVLLSFRVIPQLVFGIC